MWRRKGEGGVSCGVVGLGKGWGGGGGGGEGGGERKERKGKDLSTDMFFLVQSQTVEIGVGPKHLTIQTFKCSNVLDQISGRNLLTVVNLTFVQFVVCQV